MCLSFFVDFVVRVSRDSLVRFEFEFGLEDEDFIGGSGGTRVITAGKHLLPSPAQRGTSERTIESSREPKTILLL